METFRSILYSFRIQDVLDIAIISVLVYGILMWFKETTSRFVLVGIALLGTVYILARYFQLYLTAVVLQGFFAILLLALVVIFQEELRRFFERLAMWGKIRKETIDSTSMREAEVISQTATALAQKRVGALIVIQGDEPLDRHLEGGMPLDGTLSQSLLESIFDPHSTGHDGAVLVHRGRVVRFACHLPLSLNASKFGQLGLRHTAALGLSERSDALCIVVSEERGTISIAQEERLSVLSSPQELKETLERFYGPGAPSKQAGGLPRRLRKNFPEKSAAIFVACLLWLVFGYQRGPVARHFAVPIEYRNLPADWAMEEQKVTEAEVMLTGPDQAFRLLDQSRLMISLDLSNIREGRQRVSLTKDMIWVPSNLSIETIKPDSIQVATYRLLRMDVPIEVSTRGELPRGRILQRIEVSPPSVALLVPPALREKGMKIQTEPIDISQLTQTNFVIPKLLFPPEVRFVDPRPPSVKVTLEVREKSEEQSSQAR